MATTSQSGEIDYVEEDLARELLRNALTEEIVQQVASVIEQRPTLVFGVTVEHAEDLAQAFRQCGLRPAAVSGLTSRREPLGKGSDKRDAMAG